MLIPPLKDKRSKRAPKRAGVLVIGDVGLVASASMRGSRPDLTHVATRTFTGRVGTPSLARALSDFVRERAILYTHGD